MRTPVTGKPWLARWPSVIPPLLLVVICCGFYWRLTLSDEYTWLNSPDLVHMEAPRFQFQALRWHARALPLWDPHQWCGQPFLGQLGEPGELALFLAAVRQIGQDRAGRSALVLCGDPLSRRSFRILSVPGSATFACGLHSGRYHFCTGWIFLQRSLAGGDGRLSVDAAGVPVPAAGAEG